MGESETWSMLSTSNPDCINARDKVAFPANSSTHNGGPCENFWRFASLEDAGDVKVCEFKTVAFAPGASTCLLQVFSKL